MREHLYRNVRAHSFVCLENNRTLPMTIKVSQRKMRRSPAVKPQDSLRHDMALPLQQTFFPLGFAIEILTNRAGVLSAAAESFGHRRLRHGSAELQIRIGITEDDSARCPPPPIRREYNHLYSIVADTENQAVMDLSTGSNFVWLNEAALRDPLYFRQNFLEKVVYLLLGASVVTDIHAGCVSKRGKGILLCGNSGAGKSTLSYACARAGWTYTSDDTCYLINRLKAPRVIGHAHRVRFRPSAKMLFPELEKFEVAPRMEGKPSIEIPVIDLPPFDSVPESSVNAVVYLHRGTSLTTELLPLPRGSATVRLSEELFSAGEIRVRHQKNLEKLANTPTFELHYHSFEDAIAELNRLAARL
jgi:energy-coupling factor transporter ATP-binding protein EcfA2